MQALTEKIIEIIKEAGAIMLEARDIQNLVEEKQGHANFVTYYDKKVQEFLQEALKKALPEAVFVGEEEDVHASIQKGYAFIVDPIDGTTNFMRGCGMSAVSIGLLKDAQPVIGVIYNPYRNEIYSAEAGCGAFCNGKPIHVSGRLLADSLVVVGTAPYYRDRLADETFSVMRYYFDRCLDIRRSGSAALDLCSVACGRADLFIELTLSPWDYAAGSLIVREAGGRITTAADEAIVFDHPISIKASGCADA